MLLEAVARGTSSVTWHSSKRKVRTRGPRLLCVLKAIVFFKSENSALCVTYNADPKRQLPVCVDVVP